MKTTEKILREEVLQLKKMVESARKRLENAPEGGLRVTRKKNGVEYYCKTHKNGEETGKARENKNGRYIRKSEMNLVKKMAQRDYDRSVVKRAEERIKTIEHFLEAYDKTCLKKLYQNTNSYRKKLITPVVLLDEEFI